MPRSALVRPAMLVLTLALCAALPGVSRAGVDLPNPDGYWATSNLPPQADGVAVVIPDRDLLVLVAPSQGGAPTRTEVWAAPIADPDAWIRLAGSGPALGRGFVAVYDPVGRRILVHGGMGTFHRTWSVRLDPTVEWSEFVPAGDSPGPRWDHVAIYDPRHHRVILQGGRDDSGSLGDAWELRLNGSRPIWTPLHARGLPMGARFGHAAAYDEAGMRMILFGGGDADGSSDVWELSLRGNPAWKRIAIAGGPGADRTQHTLVLDPVGDRLLLHGGVDDAGVVQGDTWELRLGEAPAWDRLDPAGSTPPRTRHVAAFDAARQRMIVLGGAFAPPAGNPIDALSLATSPRWDRLAPVPDLPAAYFATANALSAAFDRKAGRLVVLLSRLSEDMAQTWLVDFAPNPRLSRIFDAPTRNGDGDYDEAHDRFLLHGGFSQARGGRTNATWELALGPNLGRPWSEIATGGAGPPNRRMDHVALIDAQRDQLTVFGGTALSGSCAISVDAARLELDPQPAQWWSAGGSPWPEGGAEAVGIIDEAGGRLLVHGGAFGCRYPTGHPSGFHADGTWALDLAGDGGWTRLSAPGVGPGPASDAAYDPVARRMIAVPSGVATWELPLAPGTEIWRQLAPGGDVPPVTRPATFDYDPGRDRFVLVTVPGAVRFFLPSRVGDAAPIARRAATGTPDPVTLSATPGRLALAVVANPARGSARMRVAVPAGSPGDLTLHDARGRLVTSRSLAAGTVGDVDLDLSARRAGVYFVRLSQGPDVMVRKVVLVD